MIAAGRDLHEGSRYPICFDREGAKTTLLREIKEGSLRAKGTSEAEVRKSVEAAYASGELKMPSRPAMAYMMSPYQVLFSSPLADGFASGEPEEPPQAHGRRARTAEQSAMGERFDMVR